MKCRSTIEFVNISQYVSPNVFTIISKEKLDYSKILIIKKIKKGWCQR